MNSNSYVPQNRQRHLLEMFVFIKQLEGKISPLKYPYPKLTLYGKSTAGMIKLRIKMGRLSLDYVVGPYTITRALKGKRKQETQRQRVRDWSEDAMLLPLKTEKGPQTRKCGQPLESGNGREIFLEFSEGTQPLQHLDFNSVRSISELTVQKCNMINLYCLKPLSLW